MDLLVDYRPALRARTGVGEWTHNLLRTWLQLPDRANDHVDLFVSSWKDRPAPAAVRTLAGARFLDRRIPVRWLTWAWNHWQWPPVEWLAGRRYDVAFSPTPLLVPSRAPVRVVTVHDLDFLDHPERTWGEMRRDYGRLVARHVQAADLVVAVSHFTASEVTRRLGVAADRLVVCRSGVPDWVLAPAPPAASRAGRYALFVGTLEPRKNVPGLLAAYERLAVRRPDTPPLVLAGGFAPGAESLRPDRLPGPLRRLVEVRGYVAPGERRSLYAGASVLVLPSFMEGFGLPVLEAMALGVPVVVSTCGALPEVAGDAGLAVAPDDPEALASALERVFWEPGLADAMQRRGLARAGTFSWTESAARMRERLEREVAARRAVGPHSGGRRAPRH